VGEIPERRTVIEKKGGSTRRWRKGRREPKKKKALIDNAKERDQQPEVTLLSYSGENERGRRGPGKNDKGSMTSRKE